MTKIMGLGFRAPFHHDLINGHPDIGWLEVITENYLWDQGVRRQNLLKLRENYDLAFHGVSLSLASPDSLDVEYLKSLKTFIHDFQPVRISDHLCWSSLGGHNWHDLLPFPYTEQNLKRMVDKVDLWQDFIQRPLVLENLSAYITSTDSTMSEYAFIAELCRKTGCQILLDLNNMVVNAKNFGWNASKELSKIDLKSVAQVHMAGFEEGEHFAIDTHSQKPHPDMWKLWSEVCHKRKDIPFMVEWDSDIPNFTVVKQILDEAMSFTKVSYESMV